VAAAEAAAFLKNTPQRHSSKQMTTTQPPGVQWVENLLQLKVVYACDIFTPKVQSQDTNVFFLGISCR
jgi:hypothetical protein